MPQKAIRATAPILLSEQIGKSCGRFYLGVTSYKYKTNVTTGPFFALKIHEFSGNRGRKQWPVQIDTIYSGSGVANCLFGNSKIVLSPLGWGFLGVSRTASWHYSDSKESA
jgi:hypothetical protein